MQKNTTTIITIAFVVGALLLLVIGYTGKLSLDSTKTVLLIVGLLLLGIGITLLIQKLIKGKKNEITSVTLRSTEYSSLMYLWAWWGIITALYLLASSQLAFPIFDPNRHIEGPAIFIALYKITYWLTPIGLFTLIFSGFSGLISLFTVFAAFIADYLFIKKFKPNYFIKGIINLVILFLLTLIATGINPLLNS